MVDFCLFSEPMCNKIATVLKIETENPHLQEKNKTKQKQNDKIEAKCGRLEYKLIFDISNSEIVQTSLSTENRIGQHFTKTESTASRKKKDIWTSKCYHETRWLTNKIWLPLAREKTLKNLTKLGMGKTVYRRTMKSWI